MTAPICTVDDASALLPIRAGNTSFDSKVSMLINTASVLIEQSISRELDQKQRVEYFDSPNTYKAYYNFEDYEDTSGIYLDPRPIRFMLKAFNIDMGQLFEVRYDPTRVFDDTTIMDPQYYSVDTDKGIIQIRYAMFEADQAIKITYTGGYAVSTNGDMSDSIPTEIKMACLAQVLHMFNKFNADNIGKNVDSTTGKTNVPYATQMGLVPEALTLISRYKVFGVGRS